MVRDPSVCFCVYRVCPCVRSSVVLFELFFLTYFWLSDQVLTKLRVKRSDLRMCVLVWSQFSVFFVSTEFEYGVRDLFVLFGSETCLIIWGQRPVRLVWVRDLFDYIGSETCSS